MKHAYETFIKPATIEKPLNNLNNC